AGGTTATATATTTANPNISLFICSLLSCPHSTWLRTRLRKRLAVMYRSCLGAGEVVAIRRSTYLRTMERLSGSDYRGILEFVHAAGEVAGTDPFPEQVLARLRELVPCDTVSYGDF